MTRTSYPARIPIHVEQVGGRIALHVEEMGRRIGISFDGPTYHSVTPAYEGAYVANARFSGPQTFPTRDRRMTDDFTVRAINYTEAPNEYGKTLTIGG